VKEEWKSMKDHAAALKCDEGKHLEAEEFLLATGANAKY
jgi:hypothetical protein